MKKKTLYLASYIAELSHYYTVSAEIRTLHHNSRWTGMTQARGATAGIKWKDKTVKERGGKREEGVKGKCILEKWWEKMFKILQYFSLETKDHMYVKRTI